jgi:outer membrane immunogenic protein
MKRELLAGTALVALIAATPSYAADLAFKAPPAAPVPFSWTGCFVGGHLGGAISYDKIRSSHDFSSAGFVGGGQIGCDYQFAPGWVVGAEGRAAWSSLSSDTAGRATYPASGMTVPTHFTVSNDFLASATARIGYSFTDRWLVFVRGGAAWTHEKADHALTVPPGAFGRFVPAAPIAVDPSATMTQTGWTAGTGVEWAFAPHVSASLEYNYYDFGDNVFTVTSPVTQLTGSLKDRIHTVTAGVNYRF